MEQIVAMQIPRHWLEGVPDEQATLQQIFRLGLRQYRVERALALYRDGVGSLGYIAEQLGLSKRDLIREARMRALNRISLKRQYERSWLDVPGCRHQCRTIDGARQQVLS